MKKLVIVGASGLGKEVAWLAKRMGREVQGFLDDDEALDGGEFYRKPVLGSVEDWVKFSDTQFLIAVAAPQVKEEILQRMQSLGEPEFATLVDPSADIDLTETKIGQGSVICAGTVCTADTVIGSHCVVNKLCSIGHDAVIEDFVTLAPQVMLGGHAKIGKHAEVGASSLVRQGLTVGAGAVVGMGAVVTKDVPTKSVVVGNPAKPLQPRNF